MQELGIQVKLAQMLQFIVKRLTEQCPICDDPREVVFSHRSDVVSVEGASYHHEYRDLLAFAEQLGSLEQHRTGTAILVSKPEDSVLRLGFARTGGELRYSAKHEIRFNPDDVEFGESVTYFGEIPSERVGRFLTHLIREIESAGEE